MRSQPPRAQHRESGMKIAYAVILIRMRLALVLLLSVHSSALADGSLPAAATTVAKELLRPQPLAGPFPTLTAYCDAQRAEWRDPDLKCFLDAPRPECAQEQTTALPIAPLLEVRLISVGYSCGLAIRLASGWFVHDTDSIAGDRNSTRLHSVELAPDGPEGRPELLVHVDHARWWLDSKQNDWLVCTNSVLVCGIGPTEKPACTSLLPIEWAEYCNIGGDDERSVSGLPRWKWRMAVSLIDGGKLSVRLKAGKLAPRAQAKKPPRDDRTRPHHEAPDTLPIGTHQLTWP
jgi:hypothetical protein